MPIVKKIQKDKVIPIGWLYSNVKKDFESYLTENTCNKECHNLKKREKYVAGIAGKTWLGIARLIDLPHA